LQASATALLIASASPLLLSLTEDAIAHLTLTLTPTPTPTSKAKQRAKDARRKNRKQQPNGKKERTNAKGNTKALVPLSTRAQKRRESTSLLWASPAVVVLNNSHNSSFRYFTFFSNPAHKTKIGIANRW
jgi:hypothetical protein